MDPLSAFECLAAQAGLGIVKRTSLGTKLHAQGVFEREVSAKELIKTEDMLNEKLVKTLVLLEMEPEPDQHGPTDSSLTSAPSLASSLCSLSVHHDDELDFAMSERTSRVAFSTVKVRQYAITIGDHPCCSSGYPLCLDWEYDVLPEQSIDSYEANHGHRRSRIELITSYEERKTRLEECCADDAKRLNRRLERHRCRNRDVAAFFTS